MDILYRWDGLKTLLGLRNHVLAWTYLKNVDQGSWPRESGITFLILKILMNASKRGAAEKWSNKIVAGSHSHFFLLSQCPLFHAFKEIVGAASCRDQGAV